MLDALPLADQSRAGDWPVIPALAAHLDLSAIEVLAQRLQAGDGLGLEPAILKFLDPVREPALKEAAIVARRLAVEEIAPHGPEIGRRRRLQRRDTADDGVGHDMVSVWFVTGS